MAEPIDDRFQRLGAHGSYRASLVSTQPDGISGYAGTNKRGLIMRKTGEGTLSGRSTGFLLSDRTAPTPGTGGFIGEPQPFALKGAEPIELTVARTGAGAFAVSLRFTGSINRTFNFMGTVIGDTIVGSTNAVGMSEHADRATYVFGLGAFQQNPH